MIYFLSIRPLLFVSIISVIFSRTGSLIDLLSRIRLDFKMLRNYDRVNVPFLSVSYLWKIKSTFFVISSCSSDCKVLVEVVSSLDLTIGLPVQQHPIAISFFG